MLLFPQAGIVRPHRSIASDS